MKHTRISRIAIALPLSVALAVALAPAAAFAKQDKEHGNPHANPNTKPDNRPDYMDGDLGGGGGIAGGGKIDTSINAIFSKGETKTIRDYFGSHSVETKPLPPGIAKNLQRGKPLPPGIAKRYLPSDLAGQLPRRGGYERLLVGNDVLLVEKATGIVQDILSLIN